MKTAPSSQLVPFALNDSAAHALASDLWTRACGETFALSPRALAYCARPALGVTQAGRFALVNGEYAGFVLASAFTHESQPDWSHRGWLNALVVAPRFQKLGIGHSLMEWAEHWLRGRDCRTIRVGGSLRPFAPGVPTELDSAGFFLKHGFAGPPDNQPVWDLSLDLSAYTPPASLRALDVTIRPAGPHDRAGLDAFLRREFPDRWLYEFEQHLRDDARFSDYMLLESARGIDACCVITFEDSDRPVERYYPTPLPRPWGQAGSIGVSADRRSAGYGSALLDASLRRLQANGVRGCIIDWTHHVTYYERFGFKRHRSYQILGKTPA